MPKSWELTDEQKKEINAQLKEKADQWRAEEEAREKNKVENPDDTGDDEDIDTVDRQGRNREIDDDNVR